MKYEEVFSVGFDRSYGGCDYSMKPRKLTRQEFNELVSMTYYALKQLELMVEEKNEYGLCEGERK